MNKNNHLEVVMTGTDPQGQGGIAAVVSILLEAGLFQRYKGIYIISHVADRGARGKAIAGIMAMGRMAFVCWRCRPAVVHANCSTGASFMRKSLLLSIARRFGCKTVLHMHGSCFREYATIEAGWLRHRWVRRVLRRSSAVIALSESWAQFMHELAPQANIHVINNAVAVPDEAPAPSVEHRRILFLGEVGQRKGVYELVTALAQLTSQFPDVRLVIGGDGELEQVKQLAAKLGVQDNVELLGWIGGEEKARQLQRANVFCLPSFSEGLPVAMLEAMAAARPVVVTPVGGIGEVIQDGENGLLVPPGDVGALAAALRRLVGDEAKGRDVGLEGYATMRQRFHAEGMVQRLGALYEELGSSRPDAAGGAEPDTRMPSAATLR